MEIDAAEAVDERFEPVTVTETDAFEHIGTAERQFVPHIRRQTPARFGDECIELFHSVRPEHIGGHAVGELRAEISDKQCDQLPTGHRQPLK